jgi:ribosomal protein L9
LHPCYVFSTGGLLARSYLLPRKLALAVTESNKRQIERDRQAAEACEPEEKTQAEALAARL